MVTEQAPAPSQEIAQRGIAAVRARRALARAGRCSAALAIFLYVGAEVSIGTQMAFFLHSDSVWGRSDAPFAFPLIGHIMGNDGVFGVSAEEAGKAVALYWGGAMVGRAIGSALLARVRAAVLLAIFTAIACLMCLYVFAVGGVAAGVVALCIGLFNSIMFPVIFTLTLERSTASNEATSGFLCFSIIGGALDPAAGRTRFATQQLRQSLHRAGGLLRGAVPVRRRGAPGADRAQGRAGGRDHPLTRESYG